MRESRAWQYLNERRPPWLAIERLEPMYPPGLPDCFWVDGRPKSYPLPPGVSFYMGRPLGEFLQRTVSGWLELKYCEPDDKEFRAGRIPKLRPSQPQFLRRQAANGVPGGVLLRVGSFDWLLWVAEPDHQWIKAMCSTEAIAMGVSVALPRSDIQAVTQLEYDTVFNRLQRRS